MPARAASAAITEPPAPEPTTQTSHVSVACSPLTEASESVLGASAADGAAEIGPGYPSASQLAFSPVPSSGIP